MEPHCPYCLQNSTPSDFRTKSIVRRGFFIRNSDLSKHIRFFCQTCKKSFSSATFEPCYKQKKRELNPHLFKSLASGVSQRRLALILGVNRKTVIRKFVFIGLWSHHFLEQNRLKHNKSNEIEFDDLETFEHSKLKPLSVTLAVESKTRRILGFRVARMPAKGLLVKRSLKKYGPRIDERKVARARLFSEIKDFINPSCVIRSDQNPHYISDVKKHFPKGLHLTYPGRRGCVVGQGELKAGGYDPIFSLNHTFAMLRANINRLFRRTWNTTKKPERLALHIALYSLYHNMVLIDSA